MHFKWKYDPPTPEQKKDAEKLIDNGAAQQKLDEFIQESNV